VTPFSAPIVGEVEFTSTDCSCLWKIIISILPCQQPAHNKHKTGSKKPCLAQISSNCHKHKLNVLPWGLKVYNYSVCWDRSKHQNMLDIINNIPWWFISIDNRNCTGRKLELITIEGIALTLRLCVPAFSGVDNKLYAPHFGLAPGMEPSATGFQFKLQKGLYMTLCICTWQFLPGDLDTGNLDANAIGFSDS
jgi:hypothetical protein